MSRIITNVSSLISQRILRQQNKALTVSLERLSTGLAINRGADNPSGLIASEKLRSEKVALSAAISNAERADQIASIAEGGLQEISSLLLEVQSLVGQNANTSGLSQAEKEANQLQVDSILQTIDRIASTTSFAGTKLLNGSLDFTVSGVATTVSDYTINGAKIPEGTNADVKVLVTASAQHAGLFLSTNGALDLTDGTSQFIFEIGGSKGTREFSFASGAALADIATSINSFKDVTGVSATVNGTGLMIKSTEFGSDQFVSFDIANLGGQAGDVHVLSSIDEDVIRTATPTDFTSITSPIRDDGQDVAATINGVTASGSGRTVKVRTDALDLEITLTTAGATAAGSIGALTITGGGAKFNLGPTIDVGNQVRLGLGNVTSRKLGNVATGFLDDLGTGRTNNIVDGNLETAQAIVNKVIDQVSSLRGRIGAFQKNVVGSTINALSVALENTSAAESVIRDTDFAAETANLTRSQILVAVATNTIAIANARPQGVLQLLG